MVKRIPDLATYDILTQIIANGRAIPSQIPSQMTMHSQSNDTQSNEALSTSGGTTSGGGDITSSSTSSGGAISGLTSGGSSVTSGDTSGGSGGSTSVVIPVIKVTDFDIATRMVLGQYFPSQIKNLLYLILYFLSYPSNRPLPLITGSIFPSLACLTNGSYLQRDNDDIVYRYSNGQRVRSTRDGVMLYPVNTTSYQHTLSIYPVTSANTPYQYTRLPLPTHHINTTY